MEELTRAVEQEAGVVCIHGNRDGTNGDQGISQGLVVTSRNEPIVPDPGNNHVAIIVAMLVILINTEKKKY